MSAWRAVHIVDVRSSAAVVSCTQLWWSQWQCLQCAAHVIRSARHASECNSGCVHSAQGVKATQSQNQSARCTASCKHPSLACVSSWCCCACKLALARSLTIDCDLMLATAASCADQVAHGTQHSGSVIARTCHLQRHQQKPVQPGGHCSAALASRQKV